MSTAPRPAPGSLAAAIVDADGHATVLDDRMEIEDHAVFRWLRGHQLHRGALHHLVIGGEPLPAAWRARGRRFSDVATAEFFLRGVAHDARALSGLRSLGRELNGAASPLPDDELLKSLAPRLVSGRLWALEARPVKSRFVGKTDPNAFAPINPRYGTSVDFAYIAGLEGDQWLRGYVPMRKGVVIGRSGMTVGSGFDIGQWSPRQIDSFGFPAALNDKLRPFAGHAFKGMTKSDVAKEVAGLAPVPELSKSEADLCDGTVFSQILGDALKSWNALRSPDVPEFKALSGGWQTVWLSRFYQEGPTTRVAQGVLFRNAARAGRWQDAVSALRAYTQYKDRATREADLLSSAMPPPVNPPRPKQP